MKSERPSSENLPESDSIHTLSERERRLEAEALDPLLFSRPEYASGKEKLNFEYQFSTGEILNASEDAEGIAHIVVKRGDEMILNFQDFLPNFKFVTPSYLLNETVRRHEKPDGEFSSEPFHINIGDMRDPKSILLLLHEIGHGRNVTQEGYYKDSDILRRWHEINGSFQKKHAAERRELAEAISDSERNAWAESLKLARDIKQKQGVDMLEGFKSFDELQQLISVALINYRESIGSEMISSDEGFIKNIVAEIKKKLWGDGRGTEQWQFMQTLFDKDRLKRKSIGELKNEWPPEDEDRF